MTDDLTILIATAILLQLGLWFRVAFAVRAIEHKLDGLAVGYWLEEYEDASIGSRISDRNPLDG